MDFIEKVYKKGEEWEGRREEGGRKGAREEEELGTLGPYGPDFSP